MKKRSLVAALAMLVVSAIVLTSSTYAWFATSNAAQVDSISATVTNNSGSLTVQAIVNGQPGKKGTKLVATDFAGANLTQTLVPVSLYIDNEGVQVKKVSYDATQFDGITDATKNTDYLYYEFNAEYICGANDDGTKTQTAVNITPTFSYESGAQFLYGLLAITVGETTSYYVYNASGSYYPIKSIQTTDGKIIDDGAIKNIIDDEDTGYTTGDFADLITSKATPKTSGNQFELMTVESGTTETAKIAVYVWAEGQDEQCAGTVNSASCGFSFSLAEGAKTAVNA